MKLVSFTPEDLEAIRDRYRSTRVSMMQLATDYRVSASMIFQIIHEYGRFAPDYVDPVAAAKTSETLFDMTSVGLRKWIIDQVRPELSADNRPRILTADNFDWEEANERDRQHLAALAGALLLQRYPALKVPVGAQERGSNREAYERYAPLRDTVVRNKAISYFMAVHHVTPPYFAAMFNVSVLTARRWAELGDLQREVDQEYDDA